MCRLQQRSHWPDRFFYLPNRIAPMIDAIEAIQSANAGQQREFFAMQQGHTQREIFGGAKRAGLPAGFDYRFPHLLP